MIDIHLDKDELRGLLKAMEKMQKKEAEKMIKKANREAIKLTVRTIKQRVKSL